MPYSPHLRVTAIGTLGGSGGEQFSYGINCGFFGGGFPGFAPNMDAWTDMAADVAAFHGRQATRLSSQAVLRTVKIAHIGADGKYTVDPLLFGFNVPGFNTDPAVQAHVLPQTALAVSLETDRRGPSGKGRFYLPMFAGQVDPGNGFRVSVVDAEGVRSSVVTLLNNIANQPGVDAVDIRPIVASTKGFNTEVQAVRVGRIIDTMRSRRRQLAESYTSELETDFTLTD